MTAPVCRFPTDRGPCRRPVGPEGERCYQHVGRDAVAAAASMAKATRRAAAIERANRRPHAPPAEDAPLSDQQIAGIAEVLNRHAVEYVLVGGAAAQLHGAETPASYHGSKHRIIKAVSGSGAIASEKMGISR